MACLINDGTTRTCDFQAGGLSAMYLANIDEVASWSDSDTDGVLDTITMADVSNVFYKFDFLSDTGSFGQELTVSNGQKYYNQTLTFNLSSTSELSSSSDGEQSNAEAQSLQDLVDKLNLGKFVAIAKMKNGKLFIVGKQNGLETDTNTFNSGAAGGDFAGYTFEMSAEATEGIELFNDEADIPV
jgi:hypothetical protein